MPGSGKFKIFFDLMVLLSYNRKYVMAYYEALMVELVF